MSDKFQLIADIFEKIDAIAYDKKSTPQEKLDLTVKSRSSLFPWRGQFSPELIELFLKKYSQENSVILDPFVGSGTTIFEAASLGLECYGAEINPSAVEMAKTVEFVKIKLGDRKKLIEKAEAIANESLLPYQWDLFSYQLRQQQQINFCSKGTDEEILTKILQGAKNNPLIHNLLTNAAIRYLNYRSNREISDFLKALRVHTEIVKNLPYNPDKCQVFHGDARKIPLGDKTIDLIITSPPYINVFNYHQNNRAAMEIIGWNLLEIAKSEIGANRKHRQNRFLTVVQYALDMLDSVKEMRRLLRDNGRVIIIVGRESKVRGVSIENGKLLAAIAIGGAGFILERLQERKFKNKFGEIIYEDILHLIPDSVKIIPGDEFARLLAQWMLKRASKKAKTEVVKEILDAQKRANNVKNSPLFDFNENYPKK